MYTPANSQEIEREGERVMAALTYGNSHNREREAIFKLSNFQIFKLFPKSFPQIQPVLPGGVFGDIISRIRMADDTDSGVIMENSPQSYFGLRSSISYNY